MRGGAASSAVRLHGSAAGPHCAHCLLPQRQQRPGRQRLGQQQSHSSHNLRKSRTQFRSITYPRLAETFVCIDRVTAALLSWGSEKKV
eukprot:6179407-Pleurochrysis_carterae.AAC.2